MSRTGAAPSREAEAGFTLVEVLVALVLFALIGAAGFSVLDQVLRVQAQTDGRLERLAAMQRAMHLITLDFAQARADSVSFADGSVAFRREGGGVSGGLAVRYDLADAALSRTLSGEFGAAQARQVLLIGVSGLEWQFYSAATGWTPDWPPVAVGPPPGPRAVALELTLEGAGLAGGLRRVALLPEVATP